MPKVLVLRKDGRFQRYKISSESLEKNYEKLEITPKIREKLPDHLKRFKFYYSKKPPEGPPGKLGQAEVTIGDFIFIVKRDWDYKIEVITPLEWIQPWQSDRFGEDYSVKHRTIMFLQSFGMAPNYFAGFRWENLTEEEIARRIRENRAVPQRKRTMILDPNDLISVRETETTRIRRVWEVDFTRIRGRIETRREVNIDQIIRIAQERGYPVVTRRLEAVE